MRALGALGRPPLIPTTALVTTNRIAGFLELLP